VNGKSFTNIIGGSVLRLMAVNFNLRPSIRESMRCNGSWVDFTVGLRTEQDTVEQAIRFRDGKATVLRHIPADVDVTMIMADDSVVKELLSATPNETLNMLLKSKLRLEGNLSYISLFNYYIATLMAGTNARRNLKIKEDDAAMRLSEAPRVDPALRTEMARRRNARMAAQEIDSGVHFLKDPYLCAYDIEDFPRLKGFLDIHFTTRPELCAERPRLLTDWFVENGFENDSEGKPWFPPLRQLPCIPEVV